jgi:hypothetical protein
MFLTLLPYLIAAANLLLVLAILLGLSQRIRTLRIRATNQEKIAHVESAGLSTEIGELKKRIQELEDSSTLGSEAPAAAAAENGLNQNGLNQTSLNHSLRSKVLKMHRLGHTPQRIAGSLRVNRGEVDLMVKAHKIVMRPYEEPVPAAAGEKG